MKAVERVVGRTGLPVVAFLAFVAFGEVGGEDWRRGKGVAEKVEEANARVQVNYGIANLANLND